MTSARALALFFALILSVPAFAQTPQTPPLVTRAQQVVEKKPEARLRVGFAEFQRTHSNKQAGINALREVTRSAPAADVQELLCWRMLPVGAAQRDVFRQEVAKLKGVAPTNAWIPLWELYLLTTESNRPALLDALANLPPVAPQYFPTSNAEIAHLELLKELGTPRVQAGVEVVSSRNHDALYALRDLDHALTREVDFLTDVGRMEDADMVRTARDRYRTAYRSAAKHLVEKLFALNLSGDKKGRDALLAKAKAIPYLHDRRQLTHVLERMDEEQTWRSLIEPLLKSELILIESPPDVAKLPARSVAALQIKARTKTAHGITLQYDGDVRFRLGALEVACERLTVVSSDDPAVILLTGQDKVQLRGLVGYPGGVTAERFNFHAETGSFSLGGDVRLIMHDKTIKLRSCTLTQVGELRDARSWLDDFRNALSIEAKLDLLPKIIKVYEDAELPDEVRYLLALHLLRPHLTWHAPYLPPPHDRKERREKAQRQTRLRDYDTPWREALGGERWMLGDITAKQQDAFRDELKAWYKAFNDRVGKNNLNLPPDLPIPDRELYFWRLRDPEHAEVDRAARLLHGINVEAIRDKAQHWRNEIQRNNTMVTFDISGGAVPGKPHSLLMDVRNAETVRFKLYRVDRPEELLFATSNIGRDFLYQDHGLDDRGDAKPQDLIKVAEKMASRLSGNVHSKMTFKPAWTKDQLVRAWEVQVATLKHFPAHDERRFGRRWHDRDWYGEPDANYFDDECSEHRERIEKTYRPEGETQLSSWQCERVVTIPKEVLAQPGAYVLVAEANGQTAHVPIVASPLSLTMRRCRDGVFVLASDADGTKVLAGAQVYARGAIPPRRGAEGEGFAGTTDAEGAAFARVLAFGDRAIVVHHQGRYAIGGFGQVFEGIYESHEAERWRDFARLARDRKAVAAQSEANVYADRHVVVAYTDRPTYRPGQNVQFKLIVRKLAAEKLDGPAAQGFRVQEFDAATNMALPNLDVPFDYVVLDPRGRHVADGTLKLSEFGTAAGKLALNEEAALGTYSLRVRLAGEPRLVPHVFAVKHYRRPNFEVEVTGVPAKLAKPGPLTIKVAGRYFFGGRVTNGRGEMRIVRQGGERSIVRDDAPLDDKGELKFESRLPTASAAGKYLVVGSITDASGRTETTTVPLVIDGLDAPQGTSPLASLPRFLAADQEFRLATTAKAIVAEQTNGDVANEVTFAVKNGAATLKFRSPGWYRVKAGEEESRLFVYGGSQHPLDFPDQPLRPRRDDDEVPDAHPRWVNLSDFGNEEDGGHARFEKPWQHLHALFDRQSLQVGDKLRFLVFVPQKDARLLFTIEGRTILDYALVATVGDAGRYQVVELPMKERYFPNVYVQGRVLPRLGGMFALELRKEILQARKHLESDDDDYDPRWCRIDVAKQPGKSIGAPLKVQIETDSATYRPGDAVRATIKVTDHAGQPRAAELSLAAVDESVFSFGEDRLDAVPAFFNMPYEARRFLPKPWRTSLGSQWGLNRERALSDQTKALERLQEAAAKQAEAINKMSSALEDVKAAHFTIAPLPRLDGELPSAQIPLGRRREHFQETATWLPQLRTDDKGVAQASFTLPDSLTRYRLTSLALTKTTEVGVGRTRISAGLPLAVQVFLPRFAIEKDRLLAVALIHNNTAEPRDCTFAWQIDGAVAEAPNPTPDDWKLVNDAGKFVATGRVKAPANSSVKVGIWLKLEKIGTARVVFRAAAGKEADAEVRTLPVQPLGKVANVNANEEVARAPKLQPGEQKLVGKLNKVGRIALPAGFVAQEIHLNLACSELAQALDGLDYLVDYPYGCIEQTMSRFLPAVMVKHATQHSPVTLSPEVMKKLPDVLDKGLTRLYGHQHDDGSWGWFDKDSRNFPMSVYVVYGLARCKATGTKVDAQVLERGCRYLHEELRTRKHDAGQVARAWYALALAGHANPKDLDVVAKQALTESPGTYAFCNLALACREAGMPEAGARLWAKARGAHLPDVETRAVYLNAQLAFGEKYDDCRVQAHNLLAQRTGTYWYHTRDTSWAIEALSNMLGFVPMKNAVRKLEVTLGGKTILDVREAGELKKLVHRVHLKGDQVPAQEALEIRMKADSDEPIYVSLRATGVQRLDEAMPTGTHVKLRRAIETLDGEPLKRPLKVGEMVRVRLRLDLAEAQNYLLIEERRPSLCEFAGAHLGGASAQHAVREEFRDDRLCVFFSALAAGTHEIVYYLRAETAGQGTMLPGSAYPMYDERRRGDTAASKVEVSEK